MKLQRKISFVKSGDIIFKLLAAPLDQLNFEFHEFFKIHVSSGDDKAPLLRDIGTPLERTLYDTAFKKQVNGFEKDVALYLDGKDAVTWWWRIAARRDWGLQGWMKNKVSLGAGQSGTSAGMELVP